MLPTYYRGCWHVVSRSFLTGYRRRKGIASPPHSSPVTALYSPKAFIAHAASLGQGFPHCRILPTAASRRSQDRVSVPVWPADLSVRLRILALVGRCPANWLIRRRSIPERRLAAPFQRPGLRPAVAYGISPAFARVSRSLGQVPNVLLTRSPLGTIADAPYDLPVLGASPAFILSQERTLFEIQYLQGRESLPSPSFTKTPARASLVLGPAWLSI